MCQVSLIDINDFYIKPVKKRGNYKKHPKPIPQYDPWTEIKDLYQKLASYLTLPLFSLEETVFTQGIIRGWYQLYTDEAFSYRDEICTGECFQVFEAEIIGTENWKLEDRIEIHKRLITYLESGMTLEEATERLEK